MVKRARWVLLAPTVALGALGNSALAQDAKPDDPVRRQAEELAEEASKKFGEVLKEQTPEAKSKPAARPPNAVAREPSMPLLLYWLDYSEHEYRGILRRLALEGADKGWDPTTIGWLKRSSQEFQDIMQRLARAGGPASKWDPVAEAHRRTRRDKGGGEDTTARPGTAPAPPATTAPGTAPEPGTGVVALAPATDQAARTVDGGPSATGKAMDLPAGDGRSLETPHKSDPPASTMAAAEPTRPEPGAQQAEAAPTPLAAAPAPTLRQNQGLPAGEVGEKAATRASSVHPHEEEEAAAGPGTVTAATTAGVEPGPDPRPAAPPPAGSTDGASASAPAARTSEDDKKTAEQTSDQDRSVLQPAPAQAGTASAEKAVSAAASSPALAERHASKIAKRGQLKGRAARHATAGEDERCSAAGAKVALPGWYVVKTGDTLWAIAERHYGAGARYRTIFLANRERLKRGPDLILPCQQLYLPPQRRRGS